MRSQLKEKPPSNQLEEEALNAEPGDPFLEVKQTKEEKKANYDTVTFGCVLRTLRKKLGWSASQLSECYAEFVGREDSPPDPTFIYHIESGKTMIGMARRAILASLVGMPLAGIPEPDTSTTLDVSEYTQALEWYCNKWRDGTIRKEEGAIKVGIGQLETAVFQSRGEEKQILTELFGFYQILQADVYTGNGQMARASTILSSTVERARQEKLSHLFTHALTERAGISLSIFEMTRDTESLHTAARDYKEALQEREKLSPLYCGLLDMRSGLADAYLARDNKEFTDALHVMTQGSHRIGLSTDDVRIIARLDAERYMLNRASAYLYSPMGNSALALTELEELERWYPEPRGKGRLAQRNRLFAEAYLATENYPMAVAHFEAALESASLGEVNRLAQIHTRLKNTSYWDDPDIGRLAVKINRVRYPDLFL